MSQPRFWTRDGLFEVQAVSVDGVAQYLVRRSGVWQYLPDGGRGTYSGRNPRTIAELATLVPLSDLTEVS